MDSYRLKDLISRGLGTAARHLGSEYDAFRPTSTEKPMRGDNRYLRLPAAFSSDTTAFRQPVDYGHPSWSGVFDTAYTQVGDYLQGASGTFFIAAQQSLLPSLCILTNGTLSVFRTMTPQTVGPSGYGGITRATLTCVLAEWPASILAGKTSGSGDLPGETAIPLWNVLLPTTPRPIQTADLLHDDRGIAYVVASAELSALGWRLIAKQAEV